MRKLAKIATVTAVSPIPGADRIESVEIGGWSVVAGVGAFHPGDQCVYFEPDAALPIDHPAFASLAGRSTRQQNGRTVHVLRTIKLRGVYSQGLALPLVDFPSEFRPGDVLEDDQDVTDRLGIEKWDPQVGFGTGSMDRASVFPSHLAQKTDAERVQNLSGIWPGLLAEGEWLWTEKIDGTSATYIREDATLHVCSRNFALKPNDSVYWKMCEKYGLANILKDNGDYMQGEIAGPCIQGNPLGLEEVELFVFNSSFFEPDASATHIFGVKRVPFMGRRGLPESPKALLGEVDGMKSALNPKRLAEGVVLWHPLGKKFHGLGWRSNFKAISRAYEAKLGA